MNNTLYLILAYLAENQIEYTTAFDTSVPCQIIKWQQTRNVSIRHELIVYENNLRGKIYCEDRSRWTEEIKTFQDFCIFIN